MAIINTVPEVVIWGGPAIIRKWLDDNPNKPFIARNYEFGGDKIISFDGIVFDRIVDLKFTQFKHKVSFRNCVFKKSFSLAGGINAEKKPAVNTSYFDGAEFHSNAEFGNRRFIHTTSFRNCVFSVAPSFHNSTLHQDTDFGGARFRDIESDGADRAYRTLKVAMNEVHAHHEELMFFGLEMQSRRVKARREKKWSYWLYWVYEGLSDYGQSIAKPVIALLAVFSASLPVYMLFHVGLGRFDFGNPKLDADAFKAYSYALGNSLPLLPGSSYKPALIAHVESTVIEQTFIAAHVTVSLALIFLAGLGLRNLFRLKN